MYLYENNALTISGTSAALVFQAGIGGQDVIYGLGSTDSIQLSQTDFVNWSALQGHLTQSGPNTVITLNASDTITLTNVTATSLTSSQLHLV